MNLFVALGIAWLLAGVQVLLLMTWLLISHRSSLRLSLKGSVMIVLFWPDTIVSFIGFVRAQKHETDDERE